MKANDIYLTVQMTCFYVSFLFKALKVEFYVCIYYIENNPTV